MTEVQEAKTRLLEWAKHADAAPSALSAGGIGPALGMAAAGLVLGRLLPGGSKRRGGLVSSLLGNAFSLATILPIAKAVLPMLMKKL